MHLTSSPKPIVTASAESSSVPLHLARQKVTVQSNRGRGGGWLISMSGFHNRNLSLTLTVLLLPCAYVFTAERDNLKNIVTKCNQGFCMNSPVLMFLSGIRVEKIESGGTICMVLYVLLRHINLRNKQVAV